MKLTEEQRREFAVGLAAAFTQNRLYEMYQDVVIKPTLKTFDNCNLQQSIENFLEIRHFGDPEIFDTASLLLKKLCCKDCSKCKL